MKCLTKQINEDIIQEANKYLTTCLDITHVRWIEFKMLRFGRIDLIRFAGVLIVQNLGDIE